MFSLLGACRSCLTRRNVLHKFYTLQRQNSSTRSKLFTVAEEVKEALAAGKPVVALESTIYTHGYPYPENVALASQLESLVRINGGVPATIGIVEGKAHVGMTPETLLKLISTAGSKDTLKLSRRDLGYIGGMGLRGKLLNGGTTIAGTMILAHLAGIKVFATGGLGGVHRGAENSLDISADLTELGRTPVAVISSGCKSFLDIPRTLEYLETQGVGVATFADGRTGSVDFPAFWSRDSGVRSPQTLENEADAAAVIHAQFSLPVHSGLLLANPVPAAAAMEKGQIDLMIAQAVAEADEQGMSGSANTPFVLKRIREISDGASVVANRALIEANVVRGTKVAVELAKLELKQDGSGLHGTNVHMPASTASVLTTLSESSVQRQTQDSRQNRAADALVVGSVACDTICDYTPFSTGQQPSKSPALHTSNPAKVSQSVGGVGRNVALAAYYGGARVAFASVIADDIAGLSVLDQVQQSGLDPTYIHSLKTADGARTAQYIAVNDAEKDLVLAMADMDICTRPELASIDYWRQIINETEPKWVVMDANWSPEIMSSIIIAAKTRDVPIAFEPVSAAKSARLFDVLKLQNKKTSSPLVVPHHLLNLATPNVHELKAMHEAAQSAGLMDTEHWWQTVNSFGLSSSGSRDKFSHATSAKLVDQGVPQQVIQLLPYIPSIVTKLGSQGVLITSILKNGDERLTNSEYAPHIIARNDSGQGVIGGVYMRMFSPIEKVSQSEIISVNGVGDTLLGVLIAGLVQQARDTARVEDYITTAQKAAVLTLKSKEAVAAEIKTQLS